MQNRNPNEAVCMLTRNNQLVLSEIMLLEAAINYTVLRLTTGKKVVAASTLKRFEAEFPQSHFLRINKSMMLNKAFIKRIDKNQVVLKNERVVTVSRRRLSFVLANFY